MAMRDRQPIPKKMAEAPTLRLGLSLFYRAWLDLGSCRVLGFGEGPIPWTAIADWCRSQGVEGEIRDDVFYHVRGIDNEYLKFQAEKRKRENAKS